MIVNNAHIRFDTIFSATVDGDEIFKNAKRVVDYFRNNNIRFFNASDGINLVSFCGIFFIEQNGFQPRIFKSQFIILGFQIKIFMDAVDAFVDSSREKISGTNNFTFLIRMRLNGKQKGNTKKQQKQQSIAVF